MVLFFFVRDRFLLSSWGIFPKHINGWGTSNMINGAVHVLCLAKVYKLNIWTLAWFNEQYFSDISPKLYSVGDLSFFVVALCCLLIGPHRTKKNLKDYLHAHIHKCMCKHTLSPLRRPLSSSPRGNDDSHYRLKARRPQCPYSAALLSYQTALLYWCSIISFPLSFGVHRGVVAWGERGWECGKN